MGKVGRRTTGGKAHRPRGSARQALAEGARARQHSGIGRTSVPSLWPLWDDEEASTTDCGGSSAIAVSRCCEAFAANGTSACFKLLVGQWRDSGGPAQSFQQHAGRCRVGVSCSQSGMEYRRTGCCTGLRRRICGCFPLGLVPLYSRPKKRHHTPNSAVTKNALGSSRTGGGPVFIVHRLARPLCFGHSPKRPC